jgi:hypothetical protein
MKKVLSVLCMAILAGGMIFTSCTKQWTLTVLSNNDAWGTVTGGGSYSDGATATLTATPKDGCVFVQWSDGVKTNPREVLVNANLTYTAIFENKPSVKVTFNNGIWDASYISAKYYTSSSAWDVYAAQNQNELPISDIATAITSGSSSANAAENGELDGDFYWVEYYNETYLQDQSGNYYGDYWAKNVTCNVSAFDATALTLSANVNATMFSAVEALVDGEGIENATTAPMTVNISNVSLTPNNSKAVASKKVVGKLVAAK